MSEVFFLRIYVDLALSNVNASLPPWMSSLTYCKAIQKKKEITLQFEVLYICSRDVIIQT